MKYSWLILSALTCLSATTSANTESDGFHSFIDQHQESIQALENEGYSEELIEPLRNIVICGTYTTPPTGYVVIGYTKSWECSGSDFTNASIITKVSTSSTYNICNNDIPQDWVVTNNDTSNYQCKRNPTQSSYTSDRIRYKSGRSMHVCNNSPVPDGYYVSQNNVSNSQCKSWKGKVITRY
ncbi:hypothetical protein [Photobacterium lutimaris]|uniref:hypothetical protein n=1 Tax=Photobacterium lutimaris TaxID=388278 RepID=UPI00105BC367|nr:hypothetical protein [Photobacterium lutimaris]TDR73969.1 hypothetical protein DFP78_10928 [Photobacterium lutimaris]